MTGLHQGSWELSAAGQKIGKTGDEQNVVVSMTGDPKKIIDQLLANYKSLFGDLAVEVSKNAVYYLTAELPADQIPNSLK